jgi:hypothetical protein
MGLPAQDYGCGLRPFRRFRFQILSEPPLTMGASAAGDRFPRTAGAEAGTRTMTEEVLNLDFGRSPQLNQLAFSDDPSVADPAPRRLSDGPKPQHCNLTPLVFVRGVRS